MEVSADIQLRVADTRSRLSFDPLHSLDGKRGYVIACEHSESEVSLRKKSTTGKIQWSAKKDCFELLRTVKGVIYDGIFVPDEGQEVTYLMAVNEQLVEEFKPIL